MKFVFNYYPIIVTLLIIIREGADCSTVYTGTAYCPHFAVPLVRLRLGRYWTKAADALL